MANQKTIRPIPATWGEVLRIQEEQMETTAIALRLLTQSRRCSGLLEELLRRGPVDAEPVIRPAA